MTFANLVENLQYIAIGPGRKRLSETSDDDRVKIEDICEKISDEPWIAATIQSKIKYYSSANDPSTCMGKIFGQCDKTIKLSRNISPEGCHIFVYKDTCSSPYHQHIESGSDKVLIYFFGDSHKIFQSHRQLLDSLGVFKVKILRETDQGFIPMTRDFVDINDVQVVPDPNEAGDLMILVIFILMVVFALLRPK